LISILLIDIGTVSVRLCKSRIYRRLLPWLFLGRVKVQLMNSAITSVHLLALDLNHSQLALTAQRCFVVQNRNK